MFYRKSPKKKADSAAAGATTTPAPVTTSKGTRTPSRDAPARNRTSSKATPTRTSSKATPTQDLPTPATLTPDTPPTAVL